jgi:hypothetical protein
VVLARWASNRSFFDCVSLLDHATPSLRMTTLISVKRLR